MMSHQKAATAPPCFVFGALRSGTTMFRLMLNSHPGLFNPGEADFLFDFLFSDPSHPTGWRYDHAAMRAHRIFRARGITAPSVLDGLDLLHHMLAQLRAQQDGVMSLNVHRHADLIAQILPDARFIHLVRDPRDVARSSIGMGWSGTSWRGLDHWTETEHKWDAAQIPADRVLMLRFEDLMHDLEQHLMQVCAFMSVPFSPKMLSYHHNTTYDAPDATLAQQWRQKATAREIALLEGRCGDLMAARGYAPAGAPHLPRAPERAWLDSRDKVLYWRGQIARFGLVLFLGAYVSRLPGLGRLRAHVRQRKEARIIELLK